VNPFRIASYNVNYGRPGHPSTIAAIRALDADCVFLQETTPAWERALATLGGPQKQRFRHWRPGRAGGHGLVSRLGVAFDEVLEAPTGWFPAWRVLVGPLQVLSVHLRPVFSLASGFHKSFFATGDVRRIEIEAHLRRIDRSLPTVILGDFNETDGPALGYLRERGYRQLDAGGPTWRFWRWRRTFDHVFSGPGVAASEARVVWAGASDHLPLSCTVTLE
jgi:endonuclease/exonuclease/phosphatase family metal-dependent hydrolase